MAFRSGQWIRFLCGVLAAGAHAQNFSPETDFSYRVFEQALKRGGNVVVSPSALEEALSLLKPAARKETAKSLEALHFREGHEKDFQASRGAHPVRVWVQKDYPLVAAYEKAAKKVSAQGLERAPLLDDMEATAKSINSWMSQESAGRLGSLVKEEQVEELLVTAGRVVDFVAANSFSSLPVSTFTPAYGKSRKVKFEQTEGEFPYYENDELQMVELKDADTDWALWVILPKEVKKLSHVEKMFSREVLKTWVESLQPRRVSLSLPLFRSGTREKTQDLFTGLGAGEMFGKKADFSGFTGSRELFLHGFFQAVSFSWKGGAAPVAATPAVNSATAAESDTLVGATTEGGTALEPTPLVAMRADHSFLYGVVDKASGRILVWGRLLAP